MPSPSSRMRIRFAFFLPALNYYLFFCIAQSIGDYIRKSAAQMNFIAADRYGVAVKYRCDTQISLLREVLCAAPGSRTEARAHPSSESPI